MSRRQEMRWADQQPRAAPAAPAAATNEGNQVAQLKDLASLKQQGVLTDEEFAREKARILA